MDNHELELPGYSTLPVPAYSCQPACGERSLQGNRRVHPTQAPPTGVFVKKAGQVTVTLEDQENDAQIPIYGQRALITGSILIEKSETVLEVVLKIEGKLQTISSDGGGSSVKLVDDKYPLYSHTAASSTCPSQVAFSVILPPTFRTSEGKNVPLPPTYNVAHYELPSLFVRTGYQVHVVVKRRRLGHGTIGEIWPKEQQYIHRTRPSHPILHTNCFFTSIKSTPEEWYQAVEDLKIRSPTNTSSPQTPISVHLFVPASRVYSRTNKIPFHVQLSGAVESLQELFAGAVNSPDLELGRVGTADSQSTADDTEAITQSTEVPAPRTRALVAAPTAHRPLIRVTIVRQVSVTRKSSASWKNTILAEAHVAPVPPAESVWYEPWYETYRHDGCWYDNGEEAEAEWLLGACVGKNKGHLDWKGVICASEQGEGLVGGFEVENVVVTDFITLAVSPPPRGRMMPLQITVPIKLVTESFEEELGGERGP